MFTSRLFGGTPVTSEPCSRMAPRVGSSKPAIIRIVVVLPHPDGPSREKNSPSAIARLSPATAMMTSPRAWNSFTTPASSMAGRSPAPRAGSREGATALGWVSGRVADLARSGSVPPQAGGWLSVMDGRVSLTSRRQPWTWPDGPLPRHTLLPSGVRSWQAIRTKSIESVTVPGHQRRFQSAQAYRTHRWEPWPQPSIAEMTTLRNGWPAGGGHIGPSQRRGAHGLHGRAPRPASWWRL